MWGSNNLLRIRSHKAETSRRIRDHPNGDDRRLETSGSYHVTMNEAVLSNWARGEELGFIQGCVGEQGRVEASSASPLEAQGPKEPCLGPSNGVLTVQEIVARLGD